MTSLTPAEIEDHIQRYLPATDQHGEQVEAVARDALRQAPPVAARQMR